MPKRTQPARGMRDFLPEDVRRRQYVIDVITRVYRRYGFEPLETPAVENIETLLGQYGEEGNKLIFKILRRGPAATTDVRVNAPPPRGEPESTPGGPGKPQVAMPPPEPDLALRYDLTVPLARVVAEHRGTLPKFFKRYQIQPVWRADRPARGRFREFYQCDVDAIGSRSMVVEAELCAAVSDVLRELGFQDFALRLNHRGLLTAMLERFGVPAPLRDAALVAVDKLDKVGRDGVARELTRRQVPASAADRLLAAFEAMAQLRAAVPEPRAFNVHALDRLRSDLTDTPAAAPALSDLHDITTLCGATSAGDHVVIDLSLARGLSYYTGAIMEAAVADLAGSLGGGGRYDGLIGMFLGDPVPACGFSLGLERILVVMGERQMFPKAVTRAAADVLVTLFEGQPPSDALALAAVLRGAALRVDVYPETDKIGKQLKYASTRGIRFAAIVGESERQAQTVTVKDLEDGGQQTLERSSAAAYIAAALKSEA